MRHNLNLTWTDEDGAEPSNIFGNFQGRTFAVRTSTEYFYGTDEPIVEVTRIVWEDMIVTDEGDYLIRGVADFDGDESDTVFIPLQDVTSIEYL